MSFVAFVQGVKGFSNGGFVALCTVELVDKISLGKFFGSVFDVLCMLLDSGGRFKNSLKSTRAECMA